MLLLNSLFISQLLILEITAHQACDYPVCVRYLEKYAMLINLSIGYRFDNLNFKNMFLQILIFIVQ